MSETQQDEQTEQRGLPAPPPMYVLTLAVSRDRKSETHYLMSPEEAVFILRDIADSIEAKIAPEEDPEPT